VLNCVYAEVSSDTGGFRFSNTTPATHKLAAELIEQGVDCAEINRLLFDSKSFEQLKAEGEAIKNLCLHDGGRIASTLFSYSAKRELEVGDDDLGTLIDIPRSVFGVEIAFVVKQENADGKYRVSMRSAGDFDVSRVCAKFGGGGHKRAAGCTVEAENIEAAEQKILDMLID